MALSLKVDAKSSVVGKTAALVIAHAGVAAKIALSEGAAAGVATLDAPDAGKLEGLATVCRYVVSLSGDADAVARLTGATPEEDAAIAEWLTRAGVDYGVSGVVGDDKLAHLNTHLLTRSTLCGPGAAVSLADLVVYGAVHGAVNALSADKRASPAMCNVARWADYIGGAAGGDAVFGKMAVVHADIPDVAAAAAAAAPAPPAGKGGKDGKGGDAKGGGKGGGDAAKGGGGGDKKGGDGGDKKKGENGGKGGGEGKGGDGGGGGGGEGGGGGGGGGDKKKEKKEKKEKKPQPPPPAKKEIDVSVLDIRVGTIIKAWEHPDADKLWVESIDVGEEKPRQVGDGAKL